MKYWITLIVLGLIALGTHAALEAKPETVEPVRVLFGPSPKDKAITGTLRSAIAEADKEISVAMYSLTHRDLARALVDAAGRGVEVRVILDREQFNGSKDYGTDAVDMLRRSKVKLRWATFEMDSPKPRFHHKFMVVDKERVLTGSYNWTYTGESINHETLLDIATESVAEQFSSEFERLWRRFSD